MARLTKPAPDAWLDEALHAIDDATRRKILGSLKQTKVSSSKKSQGLCAGDIEERVHLSQPTISHHMAILTKAGLVDATRQGQFRWYGRNNRGIRRLLKILRSQL